MIRKLAGSFVFIFAALHGDQPKFPEMIDFGNLSLGRNYFYDDHSTWTWELGRAAHDAGLSPFNDSPEIGAFFAYLKNTYHIDTVIETGTFEAATTRFFACCFKNVHTIEVVDTYYNDAKENLRNRPNVHCHLGSSQKVLSEILPSLEEKPVIFYLDAHWDLYWPLFDELTEIGKTHKDNCIIVIDDFKVPGRHDIGFDGYEVDGVYHECCYEAIKDHLSKVCTEYSMHYLIPRVPSHRAKFVVIPTKLMKSDRFFSLEAKFDPYPQKFEGLLPHYEKADALDLISKFIPDNPIIFEAGGHYGTETVIFAKKWPKSKVISFEPNPNGFKKLTESTGLFPNVQAYNLAVNNYNGMATLNLCYGTTGDNPKFEGASSLLEASPSMKAHYQGPKINVPCVILDDWCEQNGVDHIDAMWLDIEGLELQVLHSSPKILKTTKAIFIETNFYAFREEMTLYSDLRPFLEKEGFILLAHWYAENLQGNAIFIRKEVLQDSVSLIRGESVNFLLLKQED